MRGGTPVAAGSLRFMSSVCKPSVSLACRVGCVLGLWAVPASGDPCDLTQTSYCTWEGSNSGFFSPGDTATLIDFQTLPDGTPSFGGAAITSAFNYVLQGAFFSSAFPSLFVSGNNQVGFALTAFTSSPIANNLITAQLTNPERGVGVSVSGNSALFAYDAQNVLIASASHFQANGAFFLGVKSNTPIARVVVNNGSNSNTIDNFTLIHVPEPTSAALLVLALPVVARAQSSRGRARTV